MIPDLVDGVLPEGVHECTIAEVDATFGRFQRSDRRIHLSNTLRAFVQEALASGIVTAVLIDGSFVTGKEEPGDVDVLVAVRRDFDLTSELRPFEYTLPTSLDLPPVRAQ